jgi:hypothetical protein
VEYVSYRKFVPQNLESARYEISLLNKTLHDCTIHNQALHELLQIALEQLDVACPGNATSIQIRDRLARIPHLTY